jgi:hypothetical protein
MWDAQRDAVQRARWSSDFVGSSLGFDGLGKIMLKNSDAFAITNNGALMLKGEYPTSPTDKILIPTRRSEGSWEFAIQDASI